MRLVPILGSPAPYTTPILNALAESVDLHVVYLAAEDRVSRFDDSWGIEPTFDHSVHWARRLDLPSIGVHLELSAGVTRHLERLDPDALLLVSWNPAVLEPLLWTRWSGCAAVMWSESTAFSGLLRAQVSTQARTLLTRVFDGYVANGSQAARYLVQLGVASDRVVTSMLPAGRSALTTMRADRTTNGEIRFLFVGRLIPQKRPLELISAFAMVQAEVPNATLTLVGAGELESEVSQAAERVPGVRYLGRREGHGLGAVYTESDVLVLPALREVWGIVVNEALSHGLFVVATSEVGSAHDLIDDSNGVVVPAHDLASLAPALIHAARTVDTGDDARRLRAATMATCTPERFASDIAAATEVAVRVRRGRWRGSRRRASSPSYGR